MQDWQLTIDTIARHCEIVHPGGRIVERRHDGTIGAIRYTDLVAMARRFSAALIAVGLRPNDRVAILSWNNAMHMALWYGVSGFGAIAHPLNPRFTDDQTAWIVSHAEDRILFVDPTLVPLAKRLLPSLPSIESVVILGNNDPDLPIALSLDNFLDMGKGTSAQWGGFEEDSACSLFYTSGTTGNPKGVMYSHRSNVLHAMSVAMLYGLRHDDVVLLGVPMFHANGWGFAHVCPMLGCRLVLPGHQLDPASLVELIEREDVTLTAGVPTLWISLIDHLANKGQKLPSLQRILAGGAAISPNLIRRWRDEQGVELVPVWGMTETSPAGTMGGIIPAGSANHEERLSAAARQGRNAYGFEMQIVGEDGAELPRDGLSAGRLMVRGPAVVSRYFRAAAPVVDPGGFFDTGDIAVIHPDGAMHITDRAKDLIKSGGEWISSVAVESVAQAFPAVELCAVVAEPDAKWTERPLLIVKIRQGATCDGEELLTFLADKMPRWHVPDRVVFVADMPLGATGKIDKRALRSLHCDGEPFAERAAEIGSPVRAG